MSFAKKITRAPYAFDASLGREAAEPFKEIEAAVEYVRSFSGKAEELKLPISDELNDPIGMNMAIITDAILDKGFKPNGFEQRSGYRVYVYKSI